MELPEFMKAVAEKMERAQEGNNRQEFVRLALIVRGAIDDTIVKLGEAIEKKE